MTAEVLREAARELRSEWDGPNPMGTAWHRERDFHLAVAAWLDQMARGMAGTSYGDLPFEDAALAVARTYLGADQ